jgi:hypothetical protein
VVDNAVGVDVVGNLSPSTGNNALFGNTANYGGYAADGSDPMLDMSTPPGLLVGSPCRGTGDASHA